MNQNLLTTNNPNISEILGNGRRYHVPIYQRDYSWHQDNWQDLWDDILESEKNKQEHYLGAIVLQNVGNNQYEIIDGQQRLATITLLMLACIQKLKKLAENNTQKQENEERIAIFSNKFIGEKNAISLTYSSKLSLNKNNNDFFQGYLLLLKTPSALLLRHEKDSNKLLLEGYKFFLEKIEEKFSQDTGIEIAKFLDEVVAQKLRFIQVIVEDEYRAFLVFETLNSRGVGLSVSDLLKNYLFSLAKGTDLGIVENKWNKILDIVGINNFPNFLRHYWISRNNLVRQEHLYRELRKNIKNLVDLNTFLDSLHENALVYDAIDDGYNDIWRPHKNYLHIKKCLNILHLFNLKHHLPFLLISYEKLPHIFDKILEIVLVISFRNTIIGGYHGKNIEDEYNKTAQMIYKGEINTPTEIANGLKNLYPANNDFGNDFETKSIKTADTRSKKLVKYILCELERDADGAKEDIETTEATIEHILPQNPTENWQKVFGKNTENYIFRIGNYALIKDKANNNAGNTDYSTKYPYYQQSHYKTTYNLPKLEWTPALLEKRQKEFAKRATHIWRLDDFFL